MKSSYGMIGYITGMSALVALCVTGVSYAIAPYGTSAEVVKAERIADKPAEKADKTLASIVNDGERNPTWIAPTHKYPVSALNMKVNPGKQRLAHGVKRQGDWRLNERQMAFNAPVSMSSYANDVRTQRDIPSYQEAPRYREPIQFRERTEAR